MEEFIKDIQNLKLACIQKQEFELAAATRDIERRMLKLVENIREISTKTTRISYTKRYTPSEIVKMKIALQTRLLLSLEEINKLPFYEFETLYDLLID